MILLEEKRGFPVCDGLKNILGVQIKVPVVAES
jgi:hypothetical protein